LTIRSQIAVLAEHGVEYVVVGGQAGVLRRAIEFSHDLDILVRAVPENAARVVAAVRTIANVVTDVDTVLSRDFQQYIGDDGEEIDVHLRVVALPGYDAAVANASEVDFLGTPVKCLELPALYASKRTDRPKDAVHRQAIEARVRGHVLDASWAIDEVVLAVALDPTIAARVGEAELERLARTTAQPLLQARLAALGLPLAANPAIHEALRPVLALPASARDKILSHPGRLSALLARLPLLLPEGGWHPRAP
jgi:hypothetical protein